MKVEPVRDQKRVMNSAFKSVKHCNNYSILLPIKDTRRNVPQQITDNYAIRPVALGVWKLIVDEIGDGSLWLCAVQCRDLLAVSIQSEKWNR